MRKTLLIVLAVIVIGVLGFVALAIWGANQTFDAGNPQVAAQFKDSFKKNCVAQANKAASAQGKAFNEVETARLTQICSCGAEDTLTHFKDRNDVKILDLMTNEATMHEVEGIMQACAQKLSAQ